MKTRKDILFIRMAELLAEAVLPMTAFQFSEWTDGWSEIREQVAEEVDEIRNPTPVEDRT